MSTGKIREEISVLPRNGQSISPGLLMEPAPIGGFRKVEQLHALAPGLGGRHLGQAHILFKISVFDWELGHGQAQSRV